jgi:hypothetical protein
LIFNETVDQNFTFYLHTSRAEQETWKSKVVVENPRIEVHRLAASTELNANSSNQLDKLKGLLKSEPKKKTLVTGGWLFAGILI